MEIKEVFQMINLIKKLAAVTFKSSSREIVSKSRLTSLELHEKRLDLLKELVNLKVNQDILFNILKLSLNHPSHSQLMQDTLAVFFNESNPEKFEKFFIEFGATDGKTLSNTFLLETDYNWNGILAEPARMWHDTLRQSRRSHIDTRAVWMFSDTELLFRENEIGELSALLNCSDLSSSNSKPGNDYLVQTISLNDLLEFYNAPKKIGYLSADTEGNEYEILQKFNFNNYKFGFINIEHNYTTDRENISDLLNENGYRRILKEFSKWDDFYIPADHPLANKL
jgi:hypothetical protein